MNTHHSPNTSHSPGSPRHSLGPVAARFGRPLPPDLLAEAAHLSWPAFRDTYAPTSGPIRLGTWSMTRTRDDLVCCQATLASGDTIAAMTATASGPIGALSDMLYRLGAGVEIVGLHQYAQADGFTTFLLCERNGRRAWSMGTGATGERSSLSALIAAANRFC